MGPTPHRARNPQPLCPLFLSVVVLTCLLEARHPVLAA